MTARSIDCWVVIGSKKKTPNHIYFEIYYALLMLREVCASLSELAFREFFLIKVSNAA